MSNSSESSELSSILDKDSSARKLAQYLMRKDGAPKTHRLFDNRERRISVQVELIRNGNTENNDENRNTGNESTIPTPPAAQKQSETPAANSTSGNVKSPTIATNASNATRNRLENPLLPKTPEALPRPIFPQTPKSSQLRAPINSSDRLRRLSFKQLLGARSKRVLLNELNATENSTVFSEFEPNLQNMAGCTSTPAMSRPRAELATIVAALNKTNREFSVQKGAVPGQIILTPTKISAACQSLSSSTANTTVVNSEVQIEEASPQNHNAVTYSRRTRSAMHTNHNIVDMIITDDEDSESEEFFTNHERNGTKTTEAAATAKTNTACDATFVRTKDAVDNATFVCPTNTVANGTFLRPRPSIHTNGTAQPVNERSFLRSPQVVSSSQLQEITGGMADDETSSRQTQKQLPFLIQTRVETEIFDDDATLREVTFKRPNQTGHSTRTRKSKRHSTPDYIRVYRNALKRLKKKKRYNGSKRSLYSEKGDTTLDSTRTDNEVTSTNTVTTPPACSSEHQSVSQSAVANKNVRALRSDGNKVRSCAAIRSESSKDNQTVAKQDAQCNLRSSRSQLKTLNRSARRQSSHSSASSNDESLLRQQSASPVALRDTSRSPSLPLRSPLASNSSEEASESPIKKSTKALEESPTKRKSTKRIHSAVSINIPRPSSPICSNNASPAKQTTTGHQTHEIFASPKLRNRLRQQNGKRKRAHSAAPDANEITPPTSAICTPTTSPAKQTTASDQTHGTSPPPPSSPPLLRLRKRVRPPTAGSKKNPKSQRANSAQISDSAGSKKNPKSQRANSDSKSVTGVRRSQREPKPVRMIPYALEIYTRCYYPEKYKQLKTNVEKSKAQKRKNEGSNLQPRVKLRRLNMHAVAATATTTVARTFDAATAASDSIETAPNGITAWLRSSPVLNSSDETCELDGHFMSHEHLVCEQHKNIEFRFYNHQSDKLNLGYIIFQPKAIKKMVALKHSDMKFVCIFGEFKFKFKAKNSADVSEYHWSVGDAFAVQIGERYGIENLSETDCGQIMLIKENQNGH